MATIYEWVRDYTTGAVAEMENHKAKTSGHWVADEMAVDVGGKKVYNWNVIDSGTRYIPATHLSPYRDAHAARAVMRKAALAADKWRACIRPIIHPIKELMPEANHIQPEHQERSTPGGVDGHTP